MRHDHSLATSLVRYNLYGWEILFLVVWRDRTTTQIWLWRTGSWVLATSARNVHNLAVPGTWMLKSNCLNCSNHFRRYCENISFLFASTIQSYHWKENPPPELWERGQSYNSYWESAQRDINLPGQRSLCMTRSDYPCWLRFKVRARNLVDSESDHFDHQTSNKAAVNCHIRWLNWHLFCFRPGLEVAGPLKCKPGATSTTQAKQYFQAYKPWSSSIATCHCFLSCLDHSHQAIENVYSQSFFRSISDLWLQLSTKQIVVPVIHFCLFPFFRWIPKPDADINVGLLFQPISGTLET